MPLTAPWCIGAGITAVWLGHFAPRTVAASGGTAHMSAAFRIHLLCAVATTVCCISNLLFTPGDGAVFGRIHKWVGRLAVPASLVGTALGYVAAWTDVGVPRATAIGLAVVGVLQFTNTVQGVRAIRKAQERPLRAGPLVLSSCSSVDVIARLCTQASTGDERKRYIEQHRAAMSSLYYGCCLGPAWFRLPGWLGLVKMGSAPLWAQAAGMVPPFILTPIAIRASRNKTFW